MSGLAVSDQCSENIRQIVLSCLDDGQIRRQHRGHGRRNVADGWLSHSHRFNGSYAVSAQEKLVKKDVGGSDVVECLFMGHVLNQGEVEIEIARLPEGGDGA